MCRYVVAELIETERDYVRDLGLIVDVSNSRTFVLKVTL